MYIEYDSEADGAYIWFVPDIEKCKHAYSKEVWPDEFNDELGILFDNNGKILGIEIQPASKYIVENLLNDR